MSLTSSGSNRVASKKTDVNPEVFLEIAIGQREVGRLVIELFADTTPRTAENFRALCTGEKGLSPLSQRPLSLLNSIFHRIIPGFMAQGGDFTSGDGTGGESIYGKKFNDENFIRKHETRGLLSMANAGANTNGSQFFLTFKECPHLNGRHVVFGRVISGIEILKVMEMVATDNQDRPRTTVTVTGCGQLGVTEEQSTGAPEETVQADSGAHEDEGISKGNEMEAAAKADEAGAKEEVEEEYDETALEEKMADMTDMQKRLFKIRMKMNQGRKANKAEVENEYRRNTDPKFAHKQKYQDNLDKKKAWKSELQGAGLSEDKSFMLQTAEKALSKQERDAEKEMHRATFGWHAFTSDANYRAYDKQLDKLASKTKAKDTSSLSTDLATLEGNPLQYGRIGAQVPAAGLERLTKHIEEREDARKKFSRRRTDLGNSLDAINEDNAVFNKKIKRSFDKYTVEIRQNLERGTAV